MQIATSPQQITLLLFDDFSNYCLANAIEPFRAANDLSGETLYTWVFASLDGAQVATSSGLMVETSAWKDAPETGDFLFVMPSYSFERHASPRLSGVLRAARRRYDLIAGLDTGAWYLAAADLLAGCEATIHWDELDRFAERFPDITVTDKRYVLNDHVATCGGASTTFELVMSLLERRHGAMLALEVASLFMHGDRERYARHDLRLTQDETIGRAAALMRRNLEEPLSISAIANGVSLTQRQLETRFRAVLGISPASAYGAIRLIEARRLVTSTRLSVAEIAARCGYQNASAMTRAYGRRFGQTPRDHRAA